MSVTTALTDLRLADDRSQKVLGREIEKVNALSREIWSDQFPHSDRPSRTDEYEPGVTYYSWRLDAEFAAKTVEAKVTDLAEGDVIAYYDDTNGYGVDPTTSLRSFVLGGYGNGASIAVVAKKSPKSVTVTSLFNPARGYWGADLHTLTEGQGWGSYEERLGQSSKRSLVRLGTLDEVLANVEQHPKFSQWERHFEKVSALVEESNALRQQIRDAEKAEKAPWQAHADVLRPVLDVLNAHVSVLTDGLSVDTYDLRVVSKDDALVVAAGLYALLRITDHTAVVRAIEAAAWKA